MSSNYSGKTWTSLIEGMDLLILYFSYTQAHTHTPLWRWSAGTVEVSRGGQRAAVVQVVPAESSFQGDVPLVVNSHTGGETRATSVFKERGLGHFSPSTPCKTVTLKRVECSRWADVIRWSQSCSRFVHPGIPGSGVQGCTACLSGREMTNVAEGHGSILCLCSSDSYCRSSANRFRILDCEAQRRALNIFRRSMISFVRGRIKIKITRQKMKAWIFRHLTANVTYGLEYSSKCAPNNVINILRVENVILLDFLASPRCEEGGGAKRRAWSPAMQAVMKQETLAAIRALMPQFAMSVRLSGAMAAGNVATWVRKEEEEEEKKNPSAAITG